MNVPLKKFWMDKASVKDVGHIMDYAINNIRSELGLESHPVKNYESFNFPNKKSLILQVGPKKDKVIIVPSSSFREMRGIAYKFLVEMKVKTRFDPEKGVLYVRNKEEYDIIKPFIRAVVEEIKSRNWN